MRSPGSALRIEKMTLAPNSAITTTNTASYSVRAAMPSKSRGPKKNTAAAMRLPATVPAFIMLVMKPSDSPPFPSFASISERDWRTGMTVCSPRLQNAISATAPAQGTENIRRPAARMETIVPIRRTRQSEKRLNSARTATSNTPGISRMNSKTPRSKPLM